MKKRRFSEKYIFKLDKDYKEPQGIKRKKLSVELATKIEDTLHSKLNRYTSRVKGSNLEIKEISSFNSIMDNHKGIFEYKAKGRELVYLEIIRLEKDVLKETVVSGNTKRERYYRVLRGC